MLDSRIKRTQAANIRQQLHAPVQALVEYSDILHEQAIQLGALEMIDDLSRISSAAHQMTRVVDELLGDNGVGVEKTKHTGMEIDAQQMIRHELRTPINAIKGYGEMLVEDLADFGAESLLPDFEKMLGIANQLLGDINTYVKFSTADAFDIEGDAISAELSNDLVKSIQAIKGEGDQSSLASIETNITGHILVVDDIESNRDLLARRLRKDGHTVICAAGGFEALEQLDKSEFDLVLLDLMMPEINGYEVLIKIRADKQQRNIPVIMISALEEEDSVIRCIEAGAIDYLQKPFNPVLLKARINSGSRNKQWSDDERNERRFIKQAFSRFVSPAVVNQLLAEPEKLRLGGERVELSCVFTDLAGFTSSIEAAEPSEIMPVLNHYLGALCNIAIEHDGTIDKIIGDAVYVFFNAPLSRDDHAEAAVRCASAMQKWSKEFSLSAEAKRFNFGATRIGVHTGTAIVGNFGGDTFFNYTAYGDTINTTARLEGANKYLGTDMCISGETVSRCPSFTFRPIGQLLLKGKVQAVDAYELVDSDRYDLEYLAQYSQAIDGLTQGSVDVESLFRPLVEQFPQDPLTNFHWQRIQSGTSAQVIVFEDK
ncbi:MAG: response regulator [Arenicella sp.]|nr:response regulator [Arenicella sp.]